MRRSIMVRLNGVSSDSMRTDLPLSAVSATRPLSVDRSISVDPRAVKRIPGACLRHQSHLKPSAQQTIKPVARHQHETARSAVTHAMIATGTMRHRTHAK
jgi:hypothetical protein